MNKKSKILVLILLFVFISVAGYGVYSYYWTRGDFAGSDTITIESFNPETNASSSNEFLGNGGTVSLSCYNNVCEGQFYISNNGSTAIDVEVLNAESDLEIFEPADVYGEGYWDRADVSISGPNFNWTTTTIAAGESEALDISVNYSINGDGFTDSDWHFIDHDIDGSDTTYYRGKKVLVNFKLRATQAH